MSMVVTLHQNVGSLQFLETIARKKWPVILTSCYFSVENLAHEKGRNSHKMKSQLLEPWPKNYINNLFILLQVYSSDAKPSNL